MLLDGAQIIARSLSKCGWMEEKEEEERERCVAFVSFCHFAPLRCVARLKCGVTLTVVLLYFALMATL